jgi:hypothetical protein
MHLSPSALSCYGLCPQRLMVLASSQCVIRKRYAFPRAVPGVTQGIAFQANLTVTQGNVFQANHPPLTYISGYSRCTYPSQ